MTLTWKSTDGSTWPLDGSLGVTVVNEAEGIFTIPTDLMLDARVSGDGSALVNSRRAPRRVVLDFLFTTATPGVLTVWRSFMASLAAGGRLEYSGPDGIRTLNDIVLEAPDRSLTGQDLQFRDEDVIPVSLLALDPWWLGGFTGVNGVFSAQTPWNPALSWNAAIPWNGGGSTGLVVAGDGPTFPVVILGGPASDVTMSVNGVSWKTRRVLLAGEYMTIETYPGKRGPHMGASGFVPGIPDGSVDWELLTEASQLWLLPKGNVSVTIGASGTTGSSSWLIAWNPRFLTP